MEHLTWIENLDTQYIRIGNPNGPGSLGYGQFLKILNPYDLES